MESGSVLKGLFYGGFASCVAETSKPRAPAHHRRLAYQLDAPSARLAPLCSRSPLFRLRVFVLAVTMPIDVVKTRLQMDGSGGAVKQYTGTMDCAGKMVKADGPGALFKGLPPALVRQSTYGSLRYGLYGPIKGTLGIKPGEPVPLWKKIVAGGLAGGVASAVANPTDLMKVRMQTDGMLKDAEGKLLPKKYNGMIDCLTKTVSEEGVLALWTGVGPTVGRAVALAAAELATCGTPERTPPHQPHALSPKHRLPHLAGTMRSRRRSRRAT